ncbi:hypothetical protein ACGFZS_09725 [Streptomyces sp. NPDC048288]|uniref:hypothetical protein n=1 Tax=Streptomyces sp. NPDC048288 TaxID=3365529 RepID=UPI003712F978
MTAHRRTARALLGGAGLAAASTAYAADTAHEVLAGLGAYTALLLAWCARGYFAAQRRQLAEADWERRHVAGERPAPLVPCCTLARHSDGTAHDRRCTDPFHRLTTTSWSSR